MLGSWSGKSWGPATSIWTVVSESDSLHTVVHPPGTRTEEREREREREADDDDGGKAGKEGRADIRVSGADSKLYVIVAFVPCGAGQYA